MTRLTQLTLRGYKSIRDQQLALGDLNLFIGANGAGKSNLVSFFQLLNRMFARPPALAAHVARCGGASSLLFHGPGRTPAFEAELEYQGNDPALRNGYRFRLAHGAGDALFFEAEEVWLQREGFTTPRRVDLGAGHRESALPEACGPERPEAPQARFALGFMSRCRMYHFHDTSAEAPIRNAGRLDQDSFLMAKGENLAAFLHHLREARPQTYGRITATIRQLAPFFEDFVLEPDPLAKTLLLRWRGTASDQVFGPHQLSDGTLRAMALVTLLLQPEETRPSALVLDEPELGLHPYALRLLWELFQEASAHTQLLVATQSAALLDLAEPEAVRVVELREGESVFRRLDRTTLGEWLETYTLSELWDKNVLGGRPTR